MTDSVVHRLLVLTAFVCCAFVLASFTLFARDQLAGASKHQQTEIVTGVASQPVVVRRPVRHQPAQPRRFIDAAASALTSPFRSLVQSDSVWVIRGLPAILAVLVYGVGLGYLARFSRGRSASHHARSPHAPA